MKPTRQQKEKLVISLAENGYTTREIAKIAKISLREIGKILKNHSEEEHYDEKLSISSRAFLMFQSGKDPLDVAIHLNLDADTTKNLYRNYLELCNLDVYSHLLDELGSDLPKFLDLYRTLKNNGLLNSEFIKYFINQSKTLDVIRSEVMESSDHLTKLYVMKVALEKEIEQKSIMNNLEIQRIRERGRAVKSHSEREFYTTEGCLARWASV